MTTKSNNSTKKDKVKRQVFFGATAFVLITGAMAFNLVRECVWPRVQFNQGKERALINRPEGIKMMESALDQCEKANDSPCNKATMFYEYGAWNFNEPGLPNRFETAKKSYAKSLHFSETDNQRAKAYGMMADCDYYAGIAGDGEKNAEAALKCNQNWGATDPLSTWASYQTLGRASMNAGHYDKAVSSFKQSVAAAQRGNLLKGMSALESSEDLACAYALAGDRTLADETFFDAIKKCDRIYGIGHVASERAIAQYARALKKTGDTESAAKLAAQVEHVETLTDTDPRWQALSN